MNRPRAPLKLVVLLEEDTATRDRLIQFLQSFAESGELESEIPQYGIEVVACASREEVSDCLCADFAERAECAAIVLSDELVQQKAPDDWRDEPWEPTRWAEELRATYEDKTYASIAVMDERTRVLDIDRVLFRDCGPGEFIDVLKLVARKLPYLAPPRPQKLRGPVVVRPIDSMKELREYFKLRHQVYRPMGYLEENVENATSRMDIDWCDTKAMHVGAFALSGLSGQPKLVGTARVVVAPMGGQRYRGWTRTLASEDSYLYRNLHRTVLPLMLPIFHSTDEMSDILGAVTKQKTVCGELSRVIVTDEYRGVGLFGLLMKVALCEAKRAGAERLFLECLEIHERIYGKFGFKTLEGMRGSAPGVGRTMIRMELDPVQVDLSPGELRIIEEEGYLCACQHRDCYSGEYGDRDRLACPLGPI